MRGIIRRIAIADGADNFIRQTTRPLQVLFRQKEHLPFGKRRIFVGQHHVRSATNQCSSFDTMAEASGLMPWEFHGPNIRVWRKNRTWLGFNNVWLKK
jgi:hypothetical protein